MGVLTDLYIANTDEAEKVGLSEAAWKEFTALDIKGLDYVPMCTLYAIMSKISFEDAMDGTDTVFEASEQGPWVIKLPDNFVELLAASKDKDISAIASEWCKTDELAGAIPEIIAERLTQIIELAYSAKQQGKGLLMCTCL